MGIKTGVREVLSLLSDNLIASLNLNTFDIDFLQIRCSQFQFFAFADMAYGFHIQFLYLVEQSQGSRVIAMIFGETIMDFNVATSAALLPCGPF